MDVIPTILVTYFGKSLQRCYILPGGAMQLGRPRAFAFRANPSTALAPYTDCTVERLLGTEGRPTRDVINERSK